MIRVDFSKRSKVTRAGKDLKCTHSWFSVTDKAQWCAICGALKVNNKVKNPKTK